MSALVKGAEGRGVGGMKAVCVLGTPLSSGNRGVLALATSTLGLARRAGVSKVTFLIAGRASGQVSFGSGSADFVHYSKSPARGVRSNLAVILLGSACWRILGFVGVRRTLERWIPWIGTVRSSQCVMDIRGGDSFSDIYGLARLVEGNLAAGTALLLGRPLVLLPQTYGPFKGRLARWMAERLVRRAALVFARDKASLVIAETLRGGGCELSPDVAFSMPRCEPGGIRFFPSGFEVRPGRYIAINVNGLMFNGGYTRQNMFGLKMDYARFSERLVRELLRRCDLPILLLPHTYAEPGDVESDNEAGQRLRATLSEAEQSRVFCLESVHGPEELKWILGNSDFVVAGRMHACVGALSTGVPAVGIAYSMKFRGVFETVGMGQWVVEARTVTEDEALQHCLSLFERRDAVRSELGRLAMDAKERLVRVMDEVLALVD